MIAFLLVVRAWFSRAWGWLRKNWMWLLLPIGAIAYVIGRLSGTKTITVVDGELRGAADVEDAANKKADQVVEQAAKKRDEQIAAIQQEHAATIEKLTDKQKADAEKLSSDPQKLNDYLMEVGKSMKEQP